ncbi:F-box only protein 48 [Orycteropus afer afer]|uniref:F-box only protein n=1 Tax=Orycteropus afer afer TaxID=1230840 RepID=A0A8B6ZRI8_ORYAF|nr:F-box only protein 48 [Orycteropus afer afer]
MQKNSKRSNNSRVSDIDLNSVDIEEKKKESQNNYFELLPPEVTLNIFRQLNIQSLCRASMACRSWNDMIRNSDSLWKPHCLTVRAVCQREIDGDLEDGYSWRVTLLRNYQKSKVKYKWLSGRYSNICSPISLPEKIMYPMDADTWGEILEAELERKNCKHLVTGPYPPTSQSSSCLAFTGGEMESCKETRIIGNEKYSGTHYSNINPFYCYSAQQDNSRKERKKTRTIKSSRGRMGLKKEAQCKALSVKSSGETLQEKGVSLHGSSVLSQQALVICSISSTKLAVHGYQQYPVAITAL